MSGVDDLVGQPISQDTSFNWTWFVELATCCCLALFFLFYFNRLFATLVSYGLRAYTWHKYRVWIDIQALQLSFLAGRIFFKGIRYHGENETVLIQHGYITWRYWLRISRQVDLTTPDDDNPGDGFDDDKQESTPDESGESKQSMSDQERGRAKKDDTSEARVAINISGLEWFVYNRTPVYEAIVDDLLEGHDQTGHSHQRNSVANGGLEHKSGYANLHQDGKEKPWFKVVSASDASQGAASEQKSERYVEAGAGPVPISRLDTSTSVASNPREPATHVSSLHSLLIRMLPVEVECSKGAITLGNENTRALVVSTFAGAQGHIDAAAAGPSDIFRQVFDFDIEHPKVEMKPNPDYRRTQLAAAERIVSAAESTRPPRRWWLLEIRWAGRIGKLFRGLRLPGIRSSRGSIRTTASQKAERKIHYLYDDFQDENRSWHGLGRYMDEDERDDHEGWSHVDYARFSQILDSPAVRLNFFWDIPGKVTEHHYSLGAFQECGDINLSTPPAYGLDLAVKGGYVNYGPWADRLRVEIQAAFVPNSYRSATPAPQLEIGDDRVSTVMTIRVDLEDEVTLRVPTRERSKDWQWRGRAHTVKEAAALRKQREKRHFRFRRSQKTKLGPDVRPFGWLSVSAGQDSTVRYEMDMVARQQGFTNRLSLDLRDTKATSSVNHALLWRCQSQKVSCDLSNPLGWNSLHTWAFSVENNAMEMFLLRDHMFLLTDLISDFTAGQKPDYMTFVPFIYRIHLSFPDLKIYLNSNDYNIIDNPCDLEENAFLVLGFQQLNGTVDVPLQYFCPRQSSVLFQAEGHNGSLELITPVWNTLHTLAEDTTMATLKQLNLEGSYNYYSALSSGLSDSLFMTITGYAPKFFLHGYLIRYFMNVKENYFGEHLHFRTLEEYQNILAGNEDLGPRPGPKKENDLDVILTVRADSSCVLLPANIYSRRENVRVDILLVEADMRFTNYYMDLQVSSSPLEASLESVSLSETGAKSDITSCQLFIDGVAVYGHRLFGAPPTEPTYVCNWDFSVGEVTGECSSRFIETLIHSILAFDFTLDDAENSLPAFKKSVIHDVTFLRAEITSLRVWLVAGGAAFLLELPESEVTFGDWAGPDFAKKMRVDVPRILVAAVDYESALRSRDRGHEIVDTFACFQTSMKIGVLDKTDDLGHTRSLQQQHILYHDQRTHRAEFLLRSHKQHSSNTKKPEWARDPPSMPLPVMPEPVGRVEKMSFPSGGGRHARRRAPHRQHSFLSSSASSTKSAPSASHSLRNQQKSMGECGLYPPAAHSTYLTPPGGGSTNDHSGGSSIRGRSQDRDVHTALVTFASPWAAPHFTLHEVQPNVTSMPEMPDAQFLRNEWQPLSNDNYRDLAGREFENTPHNGLLCLLDSGLVGFCSPALFLAVGQLIRELNEEHAVDRLDKVQMAVMKRILAIQHHEDQGHIMDLAVEAPFVHVRLVNSTSDSQDSVVLFEDHYDGKLNGTRVMYRAIHPKADARSEAAGSHGHLAYGSVDGVRLSVRDAATSPEKATAHAELSLHNIGYWLSLKEELNSRLQLSNMDIVLWAEQLIHMASLIQRTYSMADHIAAPFVGLDSSSKTRHLIYHLTQAGPSVSDPVFLMRPSYVLRSADKHVRLTDSWKIMSRLRHVFSNQESIKGRNFFDECGCEVQQVSDAARRQVLSSFEQWRGWDYARDKIPIMSSFFDRTLTTKPSRLAEQLTVQSEILIGKVGITLDPGPQQSDLSLLGLDFNVFIHPPAEAYQEKDVAQRLVIQAYLADTSLHLNWALVRLARQVIELGNPLAKGSQEVRRSNKTRSTTLATRRSFTVVVGSDVASIFLTTVNLKVKWGAERFRSVASFDTGGSKPTISSFTAATNTAMSRVKGHSHTLLLWRLRSPKVHGSVWPESPARSRKSKTVLQICAASQKYRFEMKEDIVKLLTVFDRVVQDEVREIMALLDEAPKVVGARDMNIQPSKRSLRLALHLALFMDDYRLNFTVVPSLRYAIAGRVARTSVVPRDDGGHDVNFDIKENEHCFEVPDWGSKKNLSILKMPAINGRLSVGKTASVIAVRARVTVEKISLETAGIRACFDALNQPGVIKMLPKAKDIFQQVQASLEDVTGDKAEAQPENQDDTTLLLRFAIHGTLAGVTIHMSAPPAREDQDYRAEMELKLEGTSVFVHNETTDPESIHEQPQFILNSRGVGLAVYRTTGRERVNIGQCVIGLKASGKTEGDNKSGRVHVYRAWSDGITVELFEETAMVATDIAAFIQSRIKSLKFSDDTENIRQIRRMTTAGITDRLRPKEQIGAALESSSSHEATSSALYDSTYAIDLENIRLRWNMTTSAVVSPTRLVQDMVFSIRKVDLQTRQEGTARLSILDTQLQIVPRSQFENPTQRTANSALLPEIVFGAAYLSTKHDRRFAFHAKGKALDLRLASDFVIPAHALQMSLGKASADLRNSNFNCEGSQQVPEAGGTNLLGGKRLASLLIDADFAGAVVQISPCVEEQQQSSAFPFLKGEKRSRAGRYGQAVQGDNASSAVLQSPGVALKLEYKDNGLDDPALSTEVKVAASSNTLYPTVVPLIREISSSIKEILGDEEADGEASKPPTDPAPFNAEVTGDKANPAALLGRCKLNAGLYIQRQEFSLSCQPIARVAATARFADVFITANTVSAPDQERFFAILTTFNQLEASVQHVYSRESTANFEVDTIIMSVINSKHVSSATGISAVLKVSPIKTDINARQVQDFLLFREIWYPPELRSQPKHSGAAATTQEQQVYAMQRYQELSAKGTLPWHIIIAVQEVKLQVDFGQGLGKTAFTVSQFWASSKKSNDSEQNLCIGFDRVGADSVGRMSGFVELENMRARTSIRWPEDETVKNRAPLVLASLGFEHFRVKAAFDYQPFAIADISSFHFLMYNVRQGHGIESDRLVGIVEGGKVQAFCTTAAAAQALALVQAFEKLVQEKHEAYEASLRDLDKFLRRKSIFPSSKLSALPPPSEPKEKKVANKGTFGLHTDVVITLQAVDLGAFPNTYFDNQILKVEATEIQARFAVATSGGKTHSGLGMTLGQLRVALSNVNSPSTKALSEVSGPDVIERATTARGGTIVKVPRLVASMETWQKPDSNVIEYIFRSVFEGKVDVGWNYARISFIRAMWQTHSRALAQRLGKPLPPSAVKITAEPQGDGENGGQEKITAVVNVPQSKFTYVPLEPPIIDTPQLRDMGEATPPLEWIGLHRDKLPEATHSVAIVSLLEIAREVEDAYARILGAS
ncbi:Macrophage colony-stimulating factor 1 receptor [Exophiala dermatitidis]|uniref:Macrophage colony-stimulating factor 1 receptor n=1 Tax=Exophiala dermatitidis TaxID=5970 RepID=A0AAN6IVC5_EXODE|nr:Macrophage colony-stimulating factor 1 receptor [Exophiala dermatitidis]KAJ4516924.1 Macrophage colony-stimulating factor 1 receptor [Exophiala dermatitidis]KAJ4519897.1 Macrophage colony-stimulating factor 1 receptor [Exophiala dermatitidis]KAJ4534294.1 Macrophage colony-stimulating factor 1 receptor [Exophiala dermatitidis]KAJ4541485.1 Macrophage colony-stimulating factor 1 receptor [Exophiala dermatitidis]